MRDDPFDFCVLELLIEFIKGVKRIDVVSIRTHTLIRYRFAVNKRKDSGNR